MNRKKLARYLVCFIIFIFVLNYLTNLFHWDYSIWWFDMLLHFLGGFWQGLLFIYLFSPQKDDFLTFKTLLFVLFIGVGWEIFEVLVNSKIAQNPFNTLDTFSDIFFDLAGGASAVLYFYKKIMTALENTV